jgi:streptogramin lyase
MRVHFVLAGFASASALAVAIGSYAPPARAAGGHTVTEFALPNADSVPYRIAKGPDGNEWFTEMHGRRIGRISTAGAIVEFALPHGGAPIGIAAGPDGNMWFTESPGDRIGRIDMAGKIAEFPLRAGSKPIDVAAGPDGALWFTEKGANKIGRIETSGTLAEFAVTGNRCGSDVGLDNLAVDSEHVWFTEPPCDAVARMDIRTHRIATFQLPYGSAPSGIAFGLKGTIWFGELGKVGRIDAGGKIAEFSLDGDRGNLPSSFVLGPNANMWFADYRIGSGTPVGTIGRIDGAGTIANFSTGPSGGIPTGIAFGADGNLWFAEYYANKIGRLKLGT